MMRFNLNNKILIIYLIAVGLITACHNGTSLQPQASAKRSNHHLKQARAPITFGSIQMLGMPANYYGKSMLDVENSALNPEKVLISLGPQKIEMRASVINDETTTASNLFNNLQADGGFGLLSASLGAEALEKNRATNGAITLISEGYVSYPVDISIKSSKYLHPEAEEILNKEGENSFFENYGTGYISGITIGTKFSFIYKVSSTDDYTKKALKVAAAASYGSFASFAAAISAMNDITKATLNIKVDVQVNGLVTTIPSLPECAISNLAECPDLLQKFMITYFNTILRKYDDLKKQFEVQGNLNLTAFNNVFASSGVGDNSIFDMNEVKFAKYPKLQADADDELIQVQNNLIKNISKSAMLSGDAGLTKTLNDNNLLGDTISQVSNLDSLFRDSNEIIELSKSLTSKPKMEKIVAACFAGGSIKDCNGLLNSKTFLEPKSGNKSSINNYFAKLENYSTNSILQMPGYYSDVTPSLANFFWLQAKEKGTNRDILIPINLNDRTANKCAKTPNEANINLFPQYSGLVTLFKDQKAGTIFRDYASNKSTEKIPGVLEFMPVPSDLIVYPTYNSNGEITRVRRESKLMSSVRRNNFLYNNEYNCTKVLVWSPERNINEEVFKCADTFGDFNSLQFYGKKVPLKEAISNYRDKPIINRGLHQPDLKDMCYDIGARDLTREQPWCSSDNTACVSLTSNGNIVYNNTKNHFITEYGKVPANTMSVSFSPGHGPRFWYYPAKNASPISIKDTIPGVGDRLRVTDNLKFIYGTNPVYAENNISLPNDCVITSPLVDSYVNRLKWGGIQTEMLCDGKTLSRVLLPDGKYSIRDNNIYMDNWQDWENNNRAIPHDAQSFSFFFISDVHAGISCDVASYSPSVSESNKQLRNQGRWELQFTLSQREDIGGGAHHIRATLNSNTRLATPFVFATGARSGKGATYIEIWKRDWHMLIGPYNSGQDWGGWYGMSGYDINNGTPTWTNGGSAVWHNNDAIRIGC